MTTLEKLTRLQGQTAWITGARRIGVSVARSLAEAGVNIVASYRTSATEAQEVMKEVQGLGVKSQTVQMDVSDQDSVQKAVRSVRQNFPSIEILVNMASVFAATPYQKITREDWDKNISAHLLGTFWPIQTISEYMPTGGHIINIADRTVLGKIYKGYVPYVVTKAAIAALTRAMAVELAPKGIFVNAIAPGPILKPADISDAEWQAIRDSSPLRYPMTDEKALQEFSKLVLYLSSVSAATGYIYPLDQGQNL